MARPDFIILGAQKSGTSWISHNLSRVPSVFLPENEIHFFDKSYNFEKGKPWYESHFSRSDKSHLVGEKTPEYFWVTSGGEEHHTAGSHKRIHKFYPDIKFILSLRNPVERAISSFGHLVRTGRISPFFTINDIFDKHIWRKVRGHGVIEKGFYYSQLLRYLELFDREQFFILIFEEDIACNSYSTIERIFDFLGASLPDVLSKGTLNRKVYSNERSYIGLTLQYYFGLPRRAMKGLDYFFPSPSVNINRDILLRLHKIYRNQNAKLFDLIDRKPKSWVKTNYT